MGVKLFTSFTSLITILKLKKNLGNGKEQNPGQVRKMNR